MKLDEAKKLIGRMREVLERHNRLYYLEAKPEITDHGYDKLMRELIDLERAFPELQTPDSPTQRVGGAPLKAFKTIEHKVPMLSLDNTYSRKELEEFDKRVQKGLGGEPFSYFVEKKIDGVSIALIYENGFLKLGSQFILFSNTFQNSIAALLQFAEIVQAFFQCA